MLSSFDHENWDIDQQLCDPFTSRRIPLVVTAATESRGLLPLVQSKVSEERGGLADERSNAFAALDYQRLADAGSIVSGHASG